MARLGRSRPIQPNVLGTRVVVSGGTFNLFTEAAHTTPGQTGADSAVNLGTEFYVTKTAWVTKVRFLRPTVGDATIRTMAIFSTTTGGGITDWLGGFYPVTPGASGTWSSYTLPHPIQLVAGTRYRVVYGTQANAGYAGTSLYFSSGAGSTTTTQGGYLVRPNATDALDNDQGSYAYDSDFPYASFNATNYWADAEITDSDPGTGIAIVRKVGEYQTAAGAAATPFSIPLTATTPGTDLVMVAHAPAVMTMPAGWVKTTVALATTEWAYWRLPGVLHTTSLTSVSMSLNAARRVAAVVIESAPIVGSMTVDLDHVDYPFAGVWDTDYVTINKAVGFATFTVLFTSNSSGTTGPVDIATYAAFANTGSVTSTGEEIPQLWMFKNEPAYLLNRPLHAPETWTGASFSDTYTGVIGWDVAQAWAFGAGTVTADASVTGGGPINGTATVAGAGSVSALARQQPATTTLAGTGAVTANGVTISTGSISGTGSVTALVRQQPATTTIVGTGSVVALSSQQPATTALTGVGSFTALVRQQPATTTLAGVGSTTANSSVVVVGTASTTGVGTTSASVNQQATATIVGIGSTSANGSVLSIATASVTGAGATSALVTQRSAATNAGVGSVTALVVQRGAGSAVGAGTVSCSVVLVASSTVTGLGSTSATVRQVVGTTVVGAGLTTAASSMVIPGSASVAGVGTVNVPSNVLQSPSSASGVGFIGSGGPLYPGESLVPGGTLYPGEGGFTDVVSTIAAPTSATGAGAVSALARQIAGSTVTGAGSINADSGGTATGIASVVGLGSTAALTTQRTALSINGAGTVTSVSRVIPSIVSLVGAGSINTPAVRQIAPVTVAGVGAVNANSSAASGGTASVSGVGAITALITQVSSITNVTGAGAVNVPVSRQSATGAVTGAGTVLTITTIKAGAAVAGVGAVTAAGIGANQGTASVVGTGSVTALAQIVPAQITRTGAGVVNTAAVQSAVQSVFGLGAVNEPLTTQWTISDIQGVGTVNADSLAKEPERVRGVGTVIASAMSYGWTQWVGGVEVPLTMEGVWADGELHSNHLELV